MHPALQEGTQFSPSEAGGVPLPGDLPCPGWELSAEVALAYSVFTAGVGSTWPSRHPFGVHSWCGVPTAGGIFSNIFGSEPKLACLN